MRNLRHAVTAGVGVLLVTVTAVPAGAAVSSTGRNGASCSVSPQQVESGRTFVISGAGLPKSTTVTFVAVFADGSSDTASETTTSTGTATSPEMTALAVGPAAAAVSNPSKHGNQTLASCPFSVV